MKKLSAVFSILFLLCVVFYSPKEVFAIAGDVQLDLSTTGQIIGSALMTNKFTDAANTDYYLDPAAATTSLTVAGSVGIGTTGPTSPLHITAVTQSSIPTVNITNNPGNPTCEGCTNQAVQINSLDALGSLKTNIGLRVDVGNAYINYAALFMGGNVGIGTTGPGWPLHLGSTFTNIGSLVLGANDFTNLAIAGTHAATAGMGIGQITQVAISSGTQAALAGNVIFDSSGGTVTKQAGILIRSLTHATGNSYLVLGTDAIPTTNYGIYSATTNDSYFAGNVGIGTTGPTTNLHIGNSDGGGIRIGKTNDLANYVVAIGAQTAQYNLDFSGYRDSYPDQIGARIAALRFNNYQVNNALVQNTGLAFYTNPTGMNSGTTDLAERMRITPSGNVGIGTVAPEGILEVGDVSAAAGGMLIKRMDVVSGTATTIFTHPSLNSEWAGIVEITALSYNDVNRQAYIHARYAYNNAFTTLLESSQNSGITLSTSGDNMQMTIGSTAGITYRVVIRIMGGDES